MTHAELCQLAARWLRQPASRGGPGCAVALSEPRIGFLGGEIPDAIGFRLAEPDTGSVVIECKTSRADFHADRKKKHRGEAGMGQYRYFLCPEGLVDPVELPARWGLLVATRRGTVRAAHGLIATRRAYREANVGLVSTQSTLEAMRASCPGHAWLLDAEVAAPWRWDCDATREVMLLTAILSRVGDVEAANQRIRAAEGQAARLAQQVERLREEVRRNERDIASLRGQLARAAAGDQS